MATIKENYVSFEIAKLLKEKGFDTPTHTFYNEKKSSEVRFEPCLINRNASFLVSAPTIQITMKWLRKVHDIHIELNWDRGNELYSFQIWKPGKYQPEISSLDLWRIYKDDDYPGEWNYEEACEESIKYCLKNLI